MSLKWKTRIIMLLRNGNVFDGEQFQEGMEVRLSGEIVTETGYDLQAAGGEKIIDLEGDYLLPGFVDVHIHAFKGRDTMDGEEALSQLDASWSEVANTVNFLQNINNLIEYRQ